MPNNNSNNSKNSRRQTRRQRSTANPKKSTPSFWQTLPRPIIGLSPMDGVTDVAFRYMVAKHSNPDVIYTEFVNVEGLARGNIKGLNALIYNEIERPIVAQIFGIEQDSFYKAAIMVCALGFDGIDINMGCPIQKIAKKGSGAALIKTPSLAKKLIKITQKAAKDWSEGITLKQAKITEEMIKEIEKMNERRTKVHIKTKTQRPPRRANPNRPLLPISVKTRIGYDKNIAVEWTKHLLETKPAAICMHGRTLKQMYKGQSNWDAIAKAAEIVKDTNKNTTKSSTNPSPTHSPTPSTKTIFLGNGDITSYKDALQKTKTYKTDGALIGRATYGNPYLFTKNPPTLSKEVRIKTALEHLEIFHSLNSLSQNHSLQNSPYLFPFHTIKKHLAWYLKGFNGARELRMQIMACENEKEAKKKIQS